MGAKPPITRKHADENSANRPARRRRLRAAVLSSRQGVQAGYTPAPERAVFALFSPVGLITMCDCRTSPANRLRISPQAANNRLKVLVSSGAVARERIVPAGGGKEFSYRVAIPAYASIAG